MAPSMYIDVKMEKKKKNKSKDLTEAAEVMDYPDDSSRKEKKKKKKDNDSALIQLIAKYLDKRKLHKSLSSFLSETQCKSSWKTQTMDLEDIYNQYSNQDSTAPPLQTDSEKTPRQTDSERLEKSLQEPVEVPKEVKNKKKKKNTEYKDLIYNDEHKTSTHKENRNSIKDNSNPPKTSSKQIDCGKLDNTSQESPEVLNEEDKKKKKNSEDKDLIINDEKETSTNIENGNSIKEKSKPSKTSRKNKESGKLDKSFQEALEVPKEEEKKKKKKNFEDKDLIDNNEQKTSIDREKKSVKDSSKPSKVSNKSKVSLHLNESLQESLEVPKQKRKKEQEAEDEDSGDDANQNVSKKNKKDTKGCKKKILPPSSNVTIEEATKSNLNDLAENTDKSLFENTPGQKGVKEDEREANISSNSNQKSGEYFVTVCKIYHVSPVDREFYYLSNFFSSGI